MKNLSNFFLASLLLIIMASLLKKRSIDSNAKTIFDTLRADGIPDNLALLVVAQSKHETAMAGVPYSSPLFLMHHNAFGYGYVSGNSLQSGRAGNHPEDTGVYANYDSLENSVHDIAGWYRRRSNIFYHLSEPSEFAAALKAQHYYTDSISNYDSGITHFFTTQIV